MKRNYVLASVILTLVTLLASFILYSRLPDTVPTHWDLKGNVDDYGGKISVLVLPGILLLLNIVFFKILPWLSPKPFKVESFQKTYDFLMFLVIALLSYIHFLILYASLTGTMNMDQAMLGGFFLFFALLGNVLGKLKRNFWIGVRTPWTLANERVWNETHRLAGKLFVLSGLLAFLLTVAGISSIFSLVIIGATAFWSAAYSLVAYKRLERSGEI